MNEKTGNYRKVILLVAFGTSVPEAAKALDEIEKRVREKYVETKVRWAFTSRTIRTRSAERGIKLDSPETALAGLMDEGYTHAAVLSLHIVPGREFHELHHNAMRFEGMCGGFKKVLIARPLLGNHDDMIKVADILTGQYGPKRADEGVVFIGHGNKRHPSDAVYLAMNSLLSDRNPSVFAGSVQGHQTPAELLPKLRAAQLRKFRLVPLMTVAGDHARKDMAGDGPESWKSILVENGYEVEPMFHGLAENPEVVSVWLDHLDEVFQAL